MAHLRIQKPGNLDQTILDDIQAIPEISLFENLSARWKGFFPRNATQRIQFARLELSKDRARVECNHVANLVKTRGR